MAHIERRIRLVSNTVLLGTYILYGTRYTIKWMLTGPLLTYLFQNYLPLFPFCSKNGPYTVQSCLVKSHSKLLQDFYGG
jgi:hypothetical protein